jgi:hypothetical protein
MVVSKAALVDDGAVVAAAVAGSAGRVWRWNGALLDLAGATRFAADGKWLLLERLIKEIPVPNRPALAPWKVFALQLIDLASAQQVFSTETSNPDPQEEVLFGEFTVHESGTALWQGQLEGSVLSRYRAGTVDNPPAPSPCVRRGLRTDGTNGAYQFAASGYGETWLIAASGAEKLCRAEDPQMCSGAYLKGGWTAYAKPATGAMRVFRRSPDGAHTQVSVFSEDSSALAVSPSGGVALRNRNRVYVTNDGEGPVDIASSAARPVWEGDWYVMMANALFRVALTPPAAETDSGVPVVNPADGGSTDAGVAGVDAGVPVATDAATPMATIDGAVPDAGAIVPGQSDAGSVSIDASSATQDGSAVAPPAHADGGDASRKPGQRAVGGKGDGCAVAAVDADLSTPLCWALAAFALASRRTRRSSRPR